MRYEIRKIFRGGRTRVDYARGELQHIVSDLERSMLGQYAVTVEMPRQGESARLKLTDPSGHYAGQVTIQKSKPIFV